MALKTSTLQDVARVAGVSTATVSRTLSNPNVVSESTKIRVSDAVRETGYRINRAARNLRTRRSHSVLVLLPDLANPFFSTILEGISRHLSSKRYSMLIASTKQVHDSGERLIDYLDDARADGMIILDGGLSPDVVASLENAPQAGRILFACEWVDAADFPSVRSENRRGTRAAVNHLYSLGHRKIAHVTGPEGNVLMHTRKDAFVAEIAALKLDLKPDWIIAGDFSLAAGCSAAKVWITMNDRPTAVFCASDQLAMGFIAELVRHNFKVPDDVSVMGFDDIDLAEQFIPPLTSIRQDRHLIGETAATMLMERIESSDGIGKEHAAVVPVSLVIRGSTSPPHT
ncbi:LacI- family transcriptional regulator [Octadecabacter antarcticus 307]|uniref:LacI-family transcriptional regulator n=1 Tax=Octadecabacter antarcticus 307 TaxID=391626 RepID=M9RII3_9RHOB|nr:LacI family DNA-binding transcriptional regulator [Octadecabacter antarcticus]AGI69645.1 LacI- family transcriptional regulator [Octadecabacter antarcticus 307]